MKNIKNISYMLVVQLVNYVFPLITIPIVSRVFGPEKIGLINYIAAIVVYFTLVVNYGFNYTGVRRITRNRAGKDYIFSAIFFSQLFLLLFVSVFFVLCVFYIGELRENITLCIITYASCMSALFTQNWFLQAYNDFKLIAFVSFISKLISFVGIVFFVRTSSDILIYVSILNLVGFFVSLFIFFITLKKYNIKLRFPGFSGCLNFINEDKYLFLSSVVTSLYTTTGIVLLGFLGSNIEVGYYSSAQKIMDVSKSVLLIPITQIIFPILSEKFGRKRDEGLEAVRNIMPIFILLTFFFLFFINFFRRFIVYILFGHQFYDVIPLISILSVGLFFVFYGVLIGGQVMLNLGMDKAFLYIQIVVSFVSVCLNSFFISRGGALVTAFIWAFSEFIITIYQIIYLKRRGIVVINSSMLKPSVILRSFKYVFARN